MNNEPVAWMYNYENFPDSFVVCRARKSDQDIPLYTHPVKEKPHPKCDEACMYLCQMRELTDEEIDNVGDEISNLIDTYAGRREFARAILRKAQEK